VNILQRTEVNTEKIKSIGYDASTQLLEVELNSGHIYQISNVPDIVYQGFLYSNSKDAYFSSMFGNDNYLLW